MQKFPDHCGGDAVVRAGPLVRLSGTGEEADRGVGRGPGGPPHKVTLVRLIRRHYTGAARPVRLWQKRSTDSSGAGSGAAAQHGPRHRYVLLAQHRFDAGGMDIDDLACIIHQSQPPQPVQLEGHDFTGSSHVLRQSVMRQ
jgi:hypothetical protein